MKRMMILVDYVLQFAARGFIVGAIFSGLIFGAMIIMSVLMAWQMPSLRVWLTIPIGTGLGTLLGALIGLIDGVLVGVIADTFLKSNRALSCITAVVSTLGMLMLSFYFVSTPSNMFGVMTVLFTLPVTVPVLVLAGVTGWDVADFHFRQRSRQLKHA